MSTGGRAHLNVFDVPVRDTSASGPNLCSESNTDLSQL